MITAELEKNILKGMFNDTNCYVYWLDKNNVYQGCNHSYATLTGLQSLNDILGKTNLELWHGVDISIIEKIDNNNLETIGGEPIPNHSQSNIYKMPASLNT